MLSTNYSLYYPAGIIHLKIDDAFNFTEDNGDSLGKYTMNDIVHYVSYPEMYSNALRKKLINLTVCDGDGKILKKSPMLENPNLLIEMINKFDFTTRTKRSDIFFISLLDTALGIMEKNEKYHELECVVVKKICDMLHSEIMSIEAMGRTINNLKSIEEKIAQHLNIYDEHKVENGND